MPRCRRIPKCVRRISSGVRIGDEGDRSDMAEYGEWNRKGAVLSDVTAQKEYGVTRDFIEDHAEIEGARASSTGTLSASNCGCRDRPRKRPSSSVASLAAGLAKVLRMTGSSCANRPPCPSVRPFFIVLSSAS
jgi:hypothetical protein